MKPEILAPAGSMAALKAAVYAGADAVYLGGDRFGARAYADNFNDAALVEAIEYCHLYGVKVYLTINTLFRNEEIRLLYDYLYPLYEAGLDAVIVQDLGVMKYVNQCFPGLPIHASTQMMITTRYAYSMLKKYGVTRIVPARELSMIEIAALKNEEKPEVEVFVQGALCYCYSGACLLSSMIGGRSGNRGRCAQTCRLPYAFYDGEQIVNADGKYLLSPKDLCGLDSVGELIAAGVDSFKIEGRMKRPEYVAVCVEAYREVTDACLLGEDTKALIKMHKQRMAAVFNRGGFTSGYYFKQNGRDMMSMQTPGNTGTEIGIITAISGNQIQVCLEKEVYTGDIFNIGTGEKAVSLTGNVNAKAGREIRLNAPKAKHMMTGQKVFRMYHAPLMDEALQYIKKDLPVEVKGSACLLEGQCARLTLETQIKGNVICVTAQGETILQAENSPLTEAVVKQKLGQTGNTRYQFISLDVSLSENAFYSLKALKELRRTAFSMLEKEILAQSRRKISGGGEPKALAKIAANETGQIHAREAVWKLENVPPETIECIHPCAAVSSVEQYNIVCQSGRFSEIYLDLQYFSMPELTKLLQRNEGIEHYVMLPPVMRQRETEELQTILEKEKAGRILLAGFVVRNVDEFAYLHSVSYQGKIVTDASLYVMNDYAVHVIRSLFPEAVITLPVELNKGQLLGLLKTAGNAQLVGYGYQQLMVSAQCLNNNLKGCDHGNGWYCIKDRYHKNFYVKCVCKYCYNLIYNGLPTVLYDVAASGLPGLSGIQLHFTKEDGKAVLAVIKAFGQNVSPAGKITRGHFNRGVE